MYNHHQTGPAGTVMFAPPFRDPFNFNFDPLVPIGIDLVGAAMATRFAVEGKPGVTSRKGSSYSTWWNGGLRTTVYFHNMIGLLTETIGNPTPTSIPFLPAKQLPDSSLYYPIEPQQTWHFRQSIDYSVTANYAVFDVASRNRDTFLYNIYQMGKNSIERGNRDSWTATPRRIIAAQAALAPPAAAAGAVAVRRRPMRRVATSAGGGAAAAAAGAAAATVEQFQTLLRDPNLRDPRGFILPADQPDFPTATKFVNALIKTGITVHRATAPFTVARQELSRRIVRREIGAGVPAARARHVRAAGSSGRHPVSGRTADPAVRQRRAGRSRTRWASQFDRVLDGFDGPFEKVSGLQKPAPGKVTRRRAGAGFLLSHAPNDAFIAINRCWPRGEDVSWMHERRAAGGVLHRVEAVHASRPRQARGRSRRRTSTPRRGPPATPSSCASCASRSPISTAARCRQAGRASSSSSSSSRSRWSIPRRSTRATSRAGST